MLIIAKRILIFVKVPGVDRGGALALATWAGAAAWRRQTADDLRTVT
jgi:hypothetical protein